METSNGNDDGEAEPPDGSSEEEEEKKCILSIIFFLKFILNFKRIFKCINARSKKTSRTSQKKVLSEKNYN